MDILKNPASNKTNFIAITKKFKEMYVYVWARVDVGRPDQVIGTSTVGSMRSGLFFGYVAMVEGIVARLRAELGGREPAVCVATGGLANTIAGETGSIDHVSPDLTLHGLRLAWNRNEATREGGAGAPAS
ncbi:MAG TPA: type III pantothenate kinase [Acidobacteria bacterium]|nr:type III pantothenate kinase [Acidobacteriota bacterium]